MIIDVCFAGSRHRHNPGEVTTWAQLVECQGTTRGDHSPTCTGFEKDLCSITKVLANYGPNLACGPAKDGLYVFEGLKKNNNNKKQTSKAKGYVTEIV